MKRFILILALTVLHYSISAQFKQLAASEVFEEPETGYVKLLLLKNGNTAYCHITYKEGITVKIYDAARKVKASKTIEPTIYKKLYWETKTNVFEISGDIVMMIADLDDRKPVLYRFIFDGNTGSLKKEERVSELAQLTRREKGASAVGGHRRPDFNIRYDGDNNHYAVSMINSTGNRKDNRLEIIYYGPDHKELSKSAYDGLETQNEDFGFVDMTVIGKEKVCLFMNTYLTDGNTSKYNRMLLVEITPGSTQPKIQQVDHKKLQLGWYAITKYDPATRKLLVLSAQGNGESGKKLRYTPWVGTFDPFTYSIGEFQKIYPSAASRKQQELFKDEEGFTGMPQNIFVHADGSYTVVFEEVKIEVWTSSNSGGTTPITYLGHLAVANYDKTGKELNSCLIPKRQSLLDAYLYPFYHSVREMSALELGLGVQFKSFSFLDRTDKSYILFNDIERNAESILKGKVTTIASVGECDGYYFDASGNTTLPERQLVFGKSENKKERNIGFFSLSDYNKKANQYVTLKLEKEGRKKGVKIVWLEP